MAAESNTPKTNTDAGSSATSGTSGTGAAKAGGQSTASRTGGQQISGEQIFSTTEQAGGESFATTGAGSSTSSTTSGAGANQTNLSDAASGLAGGDTTKAKELLNQAREATGQAASQAFGQVQEKASTFVDTKTSDLAHGITPLVDGLRQLTDNLRQNDQQTPIAQYAARYGESFAGQLEQLAGYLDRADLNRLTRDLESFARRNPAVFVGSAFAVGVLLARFLKSGSGRRTALQTRETTRQINQMNESVTHGEPPPLGRTLPSLDASSGQRTTSGTTNTGTTPTNEPSMP